MFDSRTTVTLTKTINVAAPDGASMTWGANGNHAKVQWAGPGSDDMIVFHGTKGNGSRCLYLAKFNLNGNGRNISLEGAVFEGIS